MAGAFGGEGGPDGDPFEGFDTPGTTTADEATVAAAGEDDSLPGSGPDTSATFGECMLQCEEQFVGCITRQITRGSRISAETARVLARGMALSMRASVMNLQAELRGSARAPRKSAKP